MLHSYHAFPHYLTQPTSCYSITSNALPVWVASVAPFGDLTGHGIRTKGTLLQSCQSLWWLPRDWDSPFSAQMKLETPKRGQSAWQPKSPLDNRNEGLCGWWAYNMNPWHQLEYTISHDEGSKSVVILHATFFLYLRSLCIQGLALWCHAISVSFLLWGRNSWVLSWMSFKHYNPSYPLIGLLAYSRKQKILRKLIYMQYMLVKL